MQFALHATQVSHGGADPDVPEMGQQEFVLQLAPPEPTTL